MTSDFDVSALRILCISPFFAPLANSEAFCAAKMVEALRSRGASVTVIGSSNLGEPDRSAMWDSIAADVVDVPLPSQIERWSSLVAMARLQTPLVLTRPYTQWVDAALHQARALHQEKKFNLIYSRSLPMCAHIAGYWCAREFSLPWVANINDPWESNFWPGAEPASALRTKMYLFWLRRVLRRADLITYPCAPLHRFHCQLANLDHSAAVIPHIGSRPNAAFPDTVANNANDRFRLLHAGKLGSAHVLGRSANALLLGFRAFLDSVPAAAARASLVLVGPEDQDTQAVIRELRLEQNVETVGRVSYERSLEYISSASACVLVEADGDEGIFFASKLADYLVCGKPVLALSPRAGTAADLAHRGELIRVDHDANAVSEAIAGFYSHFENGTLAARAPSARQTRSLQPQNVAEQFLRACRPLFAQQATLRRRNATESRMPIPAANHVPESPAQNTR